MKQRVWNWSAEKNQQLIKERDVCFEDVIFHIAQGDLLDDITHPNPEKYPHQKQFVINMDNYVYIVPYVMTEKEIFLKTIIPSLKATRKYIGR